jgi:hypothetical protein
MTRYPFYRRLGRPRPGHKVHKIKIELHQAEVAILSLILGILMPNDKHLVVETYSPLLTKHNKQFC